MAHKIYLIKLFPLMQLGNTKYIFAMEFVRKRFYVSDLHSKSITFLNEGIYVGDETHTHNTLF